MIITKEDYDENIASLLYKIKDVVPKLDEYEKFMILDRFERLVVNSASIPFILKELNSFTPLQDKILEKYEITEDVKKALNYCEYVRERYFAEKNAKEQQNNSNIEIQNNQSEQQIIE